MERLFAEASSLIDAGVRPDLVRAQLIEVTDETESASFWRIWHFALAVGAPLVETLQQQAEIERALRLGRARLEKLWAAPKSTFHLVVLLPFVALISAQLGGLNPLRGFQTSWFPWFSMMFGLMLLVATFLINNRLLKKASPKPFSTNISLRLFLVAASAGHATARCYELVEANFRESGIDSEQLDNLRDLLALSDKYGAAPLRLVRSEILLELEQLQNKQEIALEKASIRLIAPAALLSMPAFALIALLPTAFSLATALSA